MIPIIDQLMMACEEALRSPHNKSAIYAKIRALLSSPENKNALRGTINQIKGGVTLFWELCRSNQTELACIFLEVTDWDLDVNQGDSDGHSPLYIAAERKNYELVKLLIKDPRVNVNTTVNGQTLLIMACGDEDLELVQILTASDRVDVNAVMRTETGAETTALLSGCQKYNKEIVERLLARTDLDINAVVTKKAVTGFLLACKNGNLTLVKRFLTFPHLNRKARTSSGEGAIFLACQYGHLAVLDVLLKNNADYIDELNQTEEHGATPFLVACENGHVHIVIRLLQIPLVDTNIRLKTGAQAFFIACQNGHLSVVKELVKRKLVTLDILNEEMSDGANAFSAACFYGHTEVVEYLLDINKQDQALQLENYAHGFWLACSEGHTDVAKKILEKRDVNFRESYYGRTPLTVACVNGRTQLAQELLKRDDIPINDRDESGDLALILACKHRNIDLVRSILKYKSTDVHAIDAKSLTAIIFAFTWGHQEVIECLLTDLRVDVCQFYQNCNVIRPYFIAIQTKRWELLRLLCHFRIRQLPGKRFVLADELTEAELQEYLCNADQETQKYILYECISKNIDFYVGELEENYNFFQVYFLTYVFLDKTKISNDQLKNWTIYLIKHYECDLLSEIKETLEKEKPSRALLMTDPINAWGLSIENLIDLSQGSITVHSQFDQRQKKSITTANEILQFLQKNMSEMAEAIFLDIIFNKKPVGDVFTIRVKDNWKALEITDGFLSFIKDTKLSSFLRANKSRTLNLQYIIPDFSFDLVFPMTTPEIHKFFSQLQKELSILLKDQKNPQLFLKTSAKPASKKISTSTSMAGSSQSTIKGKEKETADHQAAFEEFRKKWSKKFEVKTSSYALSHENTIDFVYEQFASLKESAGKDGTLGSDLIKLIRYQPSLKYGAFQLINSWMKNNPNGENYAALQENLCIYFSLVEVWSMNDESQRWAKRGISNLLKDTLPCTQLPERPQKEELEEPTPDENTEEKPAKKYRPKKENPLVAKKQLAEMTQIMQPSVKSPITQSYNSYNSRVYTLGDLTQNATDFLTGFAQIQTDLKNIFNDCNGFPETVLFRHIVMQVQQLHVLQAQEKYKNLLKVIYNSQRLDVYFDNLRHRLTHDPLFFSQFFELKEEIIEIAKAISVLSIKTVQEKIFLWNEMRGLIDGQALFAQYFTVDKKITGFISSAYFCPDTRFYSKQELFESEAFTSLLAEITEYRRLLEENKPQPSVLTHAIFYTIANLGELIKHTDDADDSGFYRRYEKLVDLRDQVSHVQKLDAISFEDSLSLVEKLRAEELHTKWNSQRKVIGGR